MTESFIRKMRHPVAGARCGPLADLARNPAAFAAYIASPARKYANLRDFTNQKHRTEHPAQSGAAPAGHRIAAAISGEDVPANISFTYIQGQPAANAAAGYYMDTDTGDLWLVS